MKRTVPRLEGEARSVARGELIGLACTIQESADPGLVGREGTVVDETLHTLRLETPGGELLVPKAACVFAFRVADRLVRIPGAAIRFRPEDRPKKVR